MTAERNQAFLHLLQQKFSSQLIEADLSLGDVVVRIRRESVADIFRLLKLDAELKMNVLLSVTAVDWLDAREERFDVVYHLMSLPSLYRLRVKVAVPESSAEVASVTSLWSGANFMEREVWDMFGIRFAGHPDLRRILMYDEFDGHPLRKDYPVQGKQPRMQLRHPEVRNTAVDMQRAELVQIGRRSGMNEGSLGKGA